MSYMDFDPCLIWERNEGLLRKVSTLRLEKWPRKTRQPRSSHWSCPPRGGALPMLRKVGLAS
jgi:hypothetical protein